MLAGEESDVEEDEVVVVVDGCGIVMDGLVLTVVELLVFCLFCGSEDEAGDFCCSDC